MLSKVKHEFSAIEDLIIWRAFVSVSKDEKPWSAAKVPKDGEFRKKMYKCYASYISHENKSVMYTGFLREHFAKKSAKAVIKRYNRVIGPEVLKFLAVMKTREMPNDEPNQEYFKMCCEKFNRKYRRDFVYPFIRGDNELVVHWVDATLLDDPIHVYNEISAYAGKVSNSFKDAYQFVFPKKTDEDYLNKYSNKRHRLDVDDDSDYDSEDSDDRE